MLRTFFFFLIFCAGFVPARRANADERPNILFILTDDQRWDSLGCMGNEIIQTPNIDEMAADGVIFDNMFCTTSICAISRASYMLGQYERRHQIGSFRRPFTAEQLSDSFPVRLRNAGYRTGIIGKWGIGFSCNRQWPHHDRIRLWPLPITGFSLPQARLRFTAG